MKQDHRIRLTKLLLREAFLDLLVEKPVAKITVKELCEQANVNRATFYAHYRDLFDLHEEIDAHFTLTEQAGEDDTVEKHYNIALRRLRKGQCFNQPYFGCREFPADVSIMEEPGDRPKSFYAGSGGQDLGFMLFDIDFDHDMEPQFFRASMRDGVIDVARAREAVVR